MLRLIWSGFTLVLFLCGCSSGEAPTRNNDFIPLTSIEIVAVAPAVAAHTSTVFSVRGNYSGQYTRDLTAQAVWSSSAPAVAGFVTAEQPNRATGLDPGQAVLTATVGSVSTTFTLTVTSARVTALTISPVAPAVARGLKSQFSVNATFSDATTRELTFDAVWSSSDPAVATVSNAVGSKGLAQALTVGTATISATFDNVSSSTQLTVTEVLLQSITVVPADLTILSQTAGNFQASGHYSDGSTAAITTQAAWKSSRPDVVTITGNGTAKTVVPGTAVLSAVLNGVTGTAQLKVTGGTLTAMVLTPATARLVKNTGISLTATGTFSNGSSRDITGVIDWSVLSAHSAEVLMPARNQAVLHARAVTAPATPARVTAQAGLITAALNLTVTAPQLQTLTVSPASLELNTGTSGRLTATATFNDGSTQDVTVDTDWTTTSVSTATVENSGLAKGRVRGIAAGNGSVTVTAAYGQLTDTTLVSVRTRTVTTLHIAGASAVAVGNQVKYTATATYSDGSTRDVTADTTWTTDQPDIASMVDNKEQPGQLVAVDSGTTTLMAAFGGKMDTVLLTIH